MIRGVWTNAELEVLVKSSPDPVRLLSGGAPLTIRHLYLEDLYLARAAVMGGFLDRRLAYRRDAQEELEDNVRNISIEFEGNYLLKKYRCNDENLPIPWRDGREEKSEVRAGELCSVLIRARNAADISISWNDDLENAFLLEKDHPRIFILYPQEFKELREELRQTILRKAGNRVGILVCPETTDSLDENAAKRLDNSRIIRQ